jgi:D-hydroxyproline dehydrogenase subunit beta
VELRSTGDGVDARFAGGETLSSDQIVLCTGVWTNELLAPLGFSVPLLPRKGQIAVLERGGVAVRTKIADFAYNDTVEDADPADPSVRTAAIIEATASGTILCGSSREFAGFDASPNDAVIGRILRDCIAIVPALATLRVIRGYAGLRPYPLDGLPIIGPVDEHRRIFVATGHEGSGHGLAAATGELVTKLVNGERPPLADRFDPARFEP